MEQKLSFVTLGVKDLKRAADFYEHQFGWKRSAMSDENILFFELKGTQLALYNREALAEDATVDAKGEGFAGITFSYLAGSETEVDELIAGFRERGVTIVKEPQKVFWGGYSSYLSDPDGYLWEIAFNPFV